VDVVIDWAVSYLGARACVRLAGRISERGGGVSAKLLTVHLSLVRCFGLDALFAIALGSRVWDCSGDVKNTLYIGGNRQIRSRRGEFFFSL
jgi:hypothetical protein